MSKKAGPIALIGIASAAVLGLSIVAGGIAQATSPQMAADLVEPDHKFGDDLYYEHSSVVLAWEKLVAGSDLEIPDGFRFSSDFEVSTGDSSDPVFVETAALDMWVAQQFRCAWLDAGLEKRASTEKMDWAMDAYWTLSGVAEFDQTGLDDETLEKLAPQLKVSDKYEALWLLSCDGWWNQ